MHGLVPSLPCGVGTYVRTKSLLSAARPFSWYLGLTISQNGGSAILANLEICVFGPSDIPRTYGGSRVQYLIHASPLSAGEFHILRY